ncbi:MAG: hypothetical protein QHH80_05705 [Anaerolineae bacterium]|nr:hypothetical protein [Anaerolineae bacterium]
MDRNKRKIRLGLSLAVVMVLVIASLALADNTVPDGDGATPIAANPLNLGDVCFGSTVEDDVLIAISRNGTYGSTNVFAKGTTVTLSVQSVSGAGLSASMTSTTITLPSNWDVVPNNTMSDEVTSHVTFTPTAPGPFMGTIVYRATGTSSKDGSTLTRDGTLSVTANVVVCDTTPPVIIPNVSGTLGNNGWYVSDVALTWTVTDPESGIASSSGCGATSVTADTSGTTFTCSATNGVGLSNSVSVTIKRDATPPTITGSRSPGPNAYGWNNTDVTVSFTCSDGLSGVDVCPADVVLSGEGAGQWATGTATDKAGNSASATVSDINIDKTPPVLTIVVPEPYDVKPLGTAFNFSATDALSGIVVVKATLTSYGASWDVDSGYVPGVGVYNVVVWATDKAGNKTMSDPRTLVIYDPSAGFVTGGGWIWSPKGAYAPDPNLEGKATFGFVAKYQKGAKVPTGQTEFQFKAGNLNFHSSSYEWLVVAGAKAQFKGVGTINGAGEYGFLLTAIDGQINGGGGVDKFRIKIWDKATSSVVYDNQMGKDEYGDFATELGGGSIVIHTGK